MCLCCGHDGTELQGQLAATSFICPSCGADLYARPPRTYAQMEGIVDRESVSATTFDRLSRLLLSASDAAADRRRRRVRMARLTAAAVLIVATVAAAAVMASMGPGWSP